MTAPALRRLARIVLPVAVVLGLWLLPRPGGHRLSLAFDPPPPPGATLKLSILAEDGRVVRRAAFDWPDPAPGGFRLPAGAYRVALRIQCPDEALGPAETFSVVADRDGTWRLPAPACAGAAAPGR